MIMDFMAQRVFLGWKVMLMLMLMLMVMLMGREAS